jgi:hypothetical protein
MEYKPKSIKPEQLARIISILEDQKNMITKEATCEKCGEIYNPEQFGELHYANECNGSPTNEIELGE